MKQRMRTMNQEISSRVQKYKDHAALNIGSSFFSMADVLPDHTSTAYWEYPMTLDYVVDLAFAGPSDAVRDAHGHVTGYCV